MKAASLIERAVGAYTIELSDETPGSAKGYRSVEEHCLFIGPQQLTVRANLKLSGYDLAIGYDPNEKTAITDYLLGRPWMELIHRGYLLEAGTDFYRISEDGTAALNSTKFNLLSRAALEAVNCDGNATATARHGEARA